MKVKVAALEVPPPGGGLSTVICGDKPWVFPYTLNGTKSSAGSKAVSCVALKKVVGMFVPFHCTSEPRRKPEPLTVRVRSGPNKGPLVGEMDEMTATGLEGAVGGGLCQSSEVLLPRNSRGRE